MLLIGLAKSLALCHVEKNTFLQRGCYDYDKTKLVIELDKLDLTGHEVYQLLKTKYHIQLELEAYTLLGIIAIGTKKAYR